MSGRNLLADAIKTDHPDWLVISTPRVVDSLVKPTCILWTGKRKRDEQLQVSILLDEIELWILTPTTKVDLIEDDLDELLMHVIETLEANQGFAWQEAERGTLAEKFDGWRMTVTCGYNITAA